MFRENRPVGGQIGKLTGLDTAVRGLSMAQNTPGGGGEPLLHRLQNQWRAIRGRPPLPNTQPNTQQNAPVNPGPAMNPFEAETRRIVQDEHTHIDHAIPTDAHMQGLALTTVSDGLQQGQPLRQQVGDIAREVTDVHIQDVAQQTVRDGLQQGQQLQQDITKAAVDSVENDLTQGHQLRQELEELAKRASLSVVNNAGGGVTETRVRELANEVADTKLEPAQLHPLVEQAIQTKLPDLTDLIRQQLGAQVAQMPQQDLQNLIEQVTRQTVAAQMQPNQQDFETAVNRVINSQIGRITAEVENRIPETHYLNEVINEMHDPNHEAERNQVAAALLPALEPDVRRVARNEVVLSEHVATRRELFLATGGLLGLIVLDGILDSQGWWPFNKGTIIVNKRTTIVEPGTTVIQPTPTGITPTPETGAVVFPTSPDEAASDFGTDPFTQAASNWNINGQGGWYLSVDSIPHIVNPQGYIAQGYIDQKNGTTYYAQPEVSNGQRFLTKGATVWPLTGTTNAQELWNKVQQENPGKTPFSIGFSPDPSVGTGQ